MARVLVGAALLFSAGAVAQAPIDEFQRWTPPAAARADPRGVVAVCEALTQAIRVADLEAGAELLDFPVLLVSDDGAGTSTGAALDRAHWIGTVDSAIEAVLRFDLKLEAQYEVAFPSSVLAVVTVRHAASARQSTKRWTSVYLLVPSKGAWKIKALGGRGWGSLPGTPRAADGKPSRPAPVELFNKRCATCHGKDGRGATVMGTELKVPDLTDPRLHARLSDGQILAQILDGSVDQVTGLPRMTAYRDKYPEDDLKALVPVVRSLKRKDALR